MNIGKYLAMTLAAAMLAGACESEDSLLSVRDGAVESPSGNGGTRNSDAPGLGGASAPGTGGGGTTMLGTGGAGTGGGAGMIGVGGTASGSTGGSGGSVIDAGGVEVAKDAPTSPDGGSPADVAVQCEAGYPVGSVRTLSDGCNTCTCLTSGVWMCTTHVCPLPDAGLEAGQCPAGQVWCPGCTPGTGSCGMACTGMVCPTDAAVAPDTGVGTCSQVTNQAECDARADCHSVFYDPGTCGCAGAGCCARFSSCRDGGTAVCVSPSPGTGFCDIATPFCESPYVIAYTSYCYEGCVLETECGS